MGKKILAVLAILVILAAGAYGAMRSQAVIDEVRQSVDTQLSGALSTRVTVGNIEVVSFHQLAAANFQVYDRQDRVMLQADKAMLTFNPWKIIQGQNPVSAISELSLSSPAVNIYQRPDNTWNVEEIINQQQQQTSDFKGKITVAGGQLNVGSNVGSWQFDSIGGQLDLSNAPEATFKLSGRQDNEPFDIIGSYGHKHYNLHVRTEKIDFAKYSKLLPAGSPVKLTQGYANQVAFTVQNDGKQLQYAVTCQLTETDVDAANLSLRNIAGRVGITQSNLYLYDTDEELNGQKIHTSGKITLDTDQPVFNLHISAAQFNPAAVKPDLPFSGDIAFDVQLKGTSDEPVVDGSVTFNDGQIESYNVTQARADLHFVGRVLTLPQFEAGILGGHVRGSGVVDFNNEQPSYSFSVNGDAEGEKIDDVIPDLDGCVNYQLAIAGVGGHPDISGTARMAVGSWRGESFSSLETGFVKTGDIIDINYLNVGIGRGALLAEGTIGSQLQLAVRGHNVSLDTVCLGKIPISGDMDFTGNITGTLDDPQFSGKMQAYDGQLFSQPFATANGVIAANRDFLSIDNLTLTDGATSHAVSGTVGFTGDRQVSMTIKTKAARAENLAAFISQGEQLTGWVDNEIYISGPADNVAATGHIVLRDGSFRGYLVEKCEGWYNRNYGVTTLRDFTIQSLNTHITAAGELSQDGQLNLGLKAQDIDIDRLHLKIPYPVSGKVSIAGNLSGTLQSPQFQGTLQAAAVTINGQQLTAINSNINVGGNNINISDGSCYQGQGQYAFEVGANLDSNVAFGNLSVVNGDVSALIAMFNLPLKDVNGLLSGNISFNGAADNPNIYLSGGITKGYIKNYPVESVNLDVSLENNVVTINTLTAKQGIGTMMMKGQADLNGAVNIEAGGYDLDAGIIPALFDTGFSAQGKLQFAAQVTGTASLPHAAVSLEVSNGSVANAAFDNLYGLFVLDNKNIHVDQLYLSKGPYRASAYGLVPLKALRNQGEPVTGSDQMNLNLKLDQANLSILPLLTKDITWAAGQTKGEVTIGGTLAQPTLNGRLLVQNGAVKLAALGEPIQKVGVDIQLKDDTIVVNSFSGQMGGGSYRVTGTAGIKGLGLDNYNLTMSFDKLGITNQYFKGPLNGTLQLTSVRGKPKLSGKILLENDTINIPFVPQIENSGLDMALDLEFVAGKRVRLYNPYLYDMLIEGKTKFDGNLSFPKPSGHINVTRGTVSYLRTQFKITQGQADFIQEGSFVPNVKLSAETAIDDVRVLLNISGPLDQMDLGLTAQPAMSKQEILSLLTLRSHYLDKQKNAGNIRDSGLGRDEMVSLLDAGLQMRFVSAMENTMKDVLGLDQFQLVRDTLSDKDTNYKQNYTDREVYNLEIGKYVTDRLLLSYTMGVDHKAYNMGFQYDLTRRISFTGSIDEQHQRTLGLGMRFNF